MVKLEFDTSNGVIYESPNKGKTVYARPFGELEPKVDVTENFSEGKVWVNGEYKQVQPS